VAAALILPGVALLLALARPLDLLSLGADEAASLGLPVHAARLGIFALSALVAGAATAVAGSVPFVGLIAPHALRPLVGPMGRRLLPASFLAGALLVVIADLGSRTLSDRLDLPLGSLTALVGAPYFVLALRGSEGQP
jgi:iron complex transport system permease protein